MLGTPSFRSIRFRLKGSYPFADRHRSANKVIDLQGASNLDGIHRVHADACNAGAAKIRCRIFAETSRAKPQAPLRDMTVMPLPKGITEGTRFRSLPRLSQFHATGGRGSIWGPVGVAAARFDARRTAF